MEFRDTARTCLIVASGRSAEAADLDRYAPGWPCLCVNDAYRLCPGATALYAADFKWWAFHIEAIRATFKGDCWSQDRKACRDFDLSWIESARAPGLSKQPGRIHTQIIGNSGAQAMNLAYLWGARRLVLVGFDFKGDHFFGDHPKEIRATTPWEHLRTHMTPLATDLSREGVQVLNCSPVSALTFWPRTTLAQALAT